MRLLEKSTGVYLKDCVLEMLAGMGINHNSVQHITTDGAGDMKEAARLLGWPRIWCVCHVIHLAVHDAIDLTEGLGAIISAVKSVVTFSKQTGSVQTNFPKVLIQSVATRWNSEFDMIERFIVVFADLSAVLM